MHSKEHEVGRSIPAGVARQLGDTLAGLDRADRLRDEAQRAYQLAMRGLRGSVIPAHRYCYPLGQRPTLVAPDGQRCTVRLDSDGLYALGRWLYIPAQPFDELERPQLYLTDDTPDGPASTVAVSVRPYALQDGSLTVVNEQEAATLRRQGDVADQDFLLAAIKRALE